MKFVGASMDDLNILAHRKFIIPFESGVIVIRHWRIHNYIRKDTYNETQCKAEKAALEIDENGAYLLTVDGTLTDRPRIVDESLTQDRLGKDRLGKDRLGKDRLYIFAPPTVDEVARYCEERHNTIDPEQFVDWYTARNWYLSKGIKMKDWKAAVRTWERRRDGDKRIPGDRTTGTKAVFDLPEVF